MGFSGPVWHASIAQVRSHPIIRRETLAREVLDGLGDAALGEWTEDAPRVFHLRRRLTVSEAARVGPVVDVRGTSDARERVRQLTKVLPEALAAWAEKEAAL
jgi:hypothetical protein